MIQTAISYHVTSHLELFYGNKTRDFGIVERRNSNYYEIIGMRDMCPWTNLRCKLILRDMRHVPNLCLNLISGFTLDKHVYESHFGGGKQRLNNNSLVIVDEVYVCTWYKTQDKVCKDELYAIEDTFLE